MSRILRRPMFRGGRVDARGTGIASGLGYEKGGRVGYEMGGNIRGGIVNLPGGYAKTATQRRLENYKKSQAQSSLDYDTIYTNEKLQEMWNKLKGSMYTGDPSSYGNLDIAYGTQIAPRMSKDVAGFQRFVDEYGEDEAYKLWSTGKLPDFNLLEEGGTDWKAEQKKQYDIDPSLFGEDVSFGEEEETVTETPTEKALRLQNENLIAQLEAFMNPQELTEDEQLAEIEKNKAMIHKAYGSGVGDDASRMLMSAASRLLEPEATVKSGLSKFLGDESKVESKRSKYKDAATTAAINAFLTGEKTMAEVDAFKAKTKFQIDEKIAAEQEALKNISLSDIGATSRETISSRKRKESAQRWLNARKTDLGQKFVNETNSKEVPTEKLFVEENIGEFFLDQETGEFFEIIRLEDGTIGKVRRE